MSATVRGDDLRAVRALIELKGIDDPAAVAIAAELRELIGAGDEVGLLAKTMRAEFIVKAWEERLHPRDHHGRFAHSPGGGAGTTAAPLKATVSRLQANRTASCPPGQLGELVRGLYGSPPPPAPPSALHKLAVGPPPEPNLFRKHAREITRENMPQIPTDAESMRRFKSFLHQKGIRYRKEHVSPTKLTATQNQLDGAKVGGFIARGFDEEKMGAILTSRELDVADGHHRWAASAVHAIEKPGYQVPILHIDADVDTLLQAMEEFDQQEGVAHTGFGVTQSATRSGKAMGDDESWQEFDPDEEPDGPPPDPDQPYMWLDGEWVLMQSDTADGIPQKLEFGS